MLEVFKLFHPTAILCFRNIMAASNYHLQKNNGYTCMYLFIYHMKHTKKYIIGDNNNDTSTKNNIFNGRVHRYCFHNQYNNHIYIYIYYINLFPGSLTRLPLSTLMTHGLNT